MSKIKQVMKLLKTKASPYGFSRKELTKVGNLILASIPDDVEDDELEEAITKKVDEYLPILQLSQANADRNRAASRTQVDDPDDDPDDEPVVKKKHKKLSNDDDDIEDEDFKDAPNWAKKLYRMVMNNNGAAQSSRRATVEEAVRNAGHLGKHFLKEFEKRTFKSDNDFNNWLDDVRSECSEYENELTERGLKKLSSPPAAGGYNRFHGQDSDVLTDDEVKELARD